VAPDAIPTLDERMDDVRDVMDATGSERAALLGTIGGAGMCGLFAAMHPDRVERLILYGSFPAMSFNFFQMVPRCADSWQAALEHIERDWVATYSFRARSRISSQGPASSSATTALGS
jgi:pimeloyl-ACP methyl ester carboxylesterase